MKSLFCVYPHCLVRTNGERILIFNPQTKSSIFCEEVEIVESFSDTDNYIFPVVEKKKSFYKEAVSKQLGYMIVAETRPFYASPKLNFVSSMKKEQRALGYNSGWRIPSLIKSISLHLNNTNVRLPKDSLYVQLDYPKCYIKRSSFSHYILDKIRNVILCSPIEIIYISGDTDKAMCQLINKMKEFYTGTIVVRTSICEYDKMLELLDADDINSNLRIEYIVNDLPIFKSITKIGNISDRVSFAMPILSLGNIMGGNSQLHIRYIPLIYDSRQQHNLIEQMLLTKEEILESTSSIEACLSKDVLNENFWGHITITIDGNLYIGSDFLGEINERTVYSLISKYLQKNNNLWQYTRNKKDECKKCLLSSLCPSISIYECQGFINRACSY